jgi:glycosyltransferase involved in cell wall biosynthesis
LLGGCKEVSRFLNSLDLFIVSSAWGEAFPNVIIEAMACQIPVITTNVGDASRIVDVQDRTVPILNPYEMAQAALKVLVLSDDARKLIGENCRNRVAKYYDINRVKQEYYSIWRDTTN